MKKLIYPILICGLSLFSVACAKATRTAVSTEQAPAAIGPYSQAILAEDHLYLSGQIPLDPATGKLVEGGIEAQIRQVMKNLQGILNAAGYDFDNVVKTEVFLTDLAQYSTLNSIYATYFKTAPPARFVVQVERLPKDALVEIAMTAVKID